MEDFDEEFLSAMQTAYICAIEDSIDHELLVDELMKVLVFKMGAPAFDRWIESVAE